MKIRKINIYDISQLSKLFDNYRIFYGKESDLQGSEKFLKERIEKNESEIFVAENEKDELIGFVQLYPIFSSTRMKRLWLLNDLFIEDICRGKGISVLLIEQKLTIAMAISDRVLVMGHGHIVFDGTPEALKQDAGIRKEWLEV